MPSADKISLEVFMMRFSFSSVTLAAYLREILHCTRDGTINPYSQKSNMNQHNNENFTAEFMANWCNAP